MDADLKILVVEPDADRARQITDALVEGGNRDVKVLGDTTGLARMMSQMDPDLVLIDLANPSRDLLEQVSAATDPQSRPVALFVDKSDDLMTTAAIEAGLSAYVVGVMNADRIRPVLITAIVRFQLMSQMRSELAAAKKALEDRKTIDRAKGLLMRARSIGVDEAYTLLRGTACFLRCRLRWLWDFRVCQRRSMPP